MLVGAETFSNLFHFLYLSVHSKNLIQFPLYRIPNTSFKKMEKKVLHDFRPIFSFSNLKVRNHILQNETIDGAKIQIFKHFGCFSHTLARHQQVICLCFFSSQNIATWFLLRCFARSQGRFGAFRPRK